MGCEKKEPCLSSQTCSGQSVTATIPPAPGTCPACEDYASRQRIKHVAVMCCEGSCLRGEIARQASNILCHTIMPGDTVRICLGGAFTKDTGQRGLVRDAERLIAVEGCFLKCATRMMQGVIDGLEPEVVVADGLIEFDTTLFGVDEMPEYEIRAHAVNVAEQLAARLTAQPGQCCAGSAPLACS